MQKCIQVFQLFARITCMYVYIYIYIIHIHSYMHTNTHTKIITKLINYYYYYNYRLYNIILYKIITFFLHIYCLSTYEYIVYIYIYIYKHTHPHTYIYVYMKHYIVKYFNNWTAYLMMSSYQRLYLRQGSVATRISCFRKIHILSSRLLSLICVLGSVVSSAVHKITINSLWNGNVNLLECLKDNISH